MSAEAILDHKISDGDEESTKRRQIVEGARAEFLTKGFDAASMNDIARAAGVSKGTLYVYFTNKEQLFEAIIEQECEAQAEAIFDLDHGDHDVETVLTRLGNAYVRFLCRPEKAQAVRTVIAIAERMPELGSKFYEKGPAKGIAKLAAYIEAQVAAGLLVVDDCEIAAAQFMEACQAMIFKSMVFNFASAPTPERVDRVVRIAVKTFLAAYRTAA